MAAKEQPEPKHHHYVQRAYLEGFIDFDYERRRESYLWTYMPKKSPFRQKPERIAKRNYYYCFERDNKRRFDVEHVLQQLEDVSLPVLKKLRSSQLDINPEERLTFAGYMALSYTRVPTFERTINRVTAIHEALEVEKFAANVENLKLMAKEERELTGQEVTADEIRGRFTGGNVVVTQKSREWSLSQMVRVTIMIQQILFNMRWIFLVAPDGDQGFLTSDNPVSLFDAPHVDVPGTGFLSSSEAYLTFPVSRDICLLLRHRAGVSQAVTRVASSRVREVNKGTILRADTQLYAPFQSRKVQQLLDSVVNARPAPKRVLIKKGKVVEE
jgi:hypothetical protein